MILRSLVLLVVVVVLTIGCGGEAQSPTATQPADTSIATNSTASESSDGAVAEEPSTLGQSIFSGKGLCSTCHKIEGIQGAIGVIGPDLTDIATRAASRTPGMTAEEFIKESIIEPDAVTTEGYSAGVMAATLGAVSLSDQDIDNLIAFLMTLD